MGMRYDEEFKAFAIEYYEEARSLSAGPLPT